MTGQGRTRIKIAVVGVRGVPGVIGGIETHCAQLYPALSAQAPEFDIRIIVRRRYASVRSTKLNGVEVHALWAPRRHAIETLVHTPLAVLYARIWQRAQLVHLHAIGPAFFAPLARLLGMRVIVTHHAPDFLRPKWSWAARKFLRWGEWLAARFADRVICVSEALAGDFLRRHPNAQSKIEVVRHGIMPPVVASLESSRVLTELGLQPGRYLLAVGRYDETKRFEQLVLAHRRAGPEVLPLVIVGSGDRTIAARLAAIATDKVRLAGSRTGAALDALYRHAAAFVHPSAMEGFALVILEALAAGLPVRVSDIPVHREFGLEEGSYFPLDDQNALAVALMAVMPRTKPCLESLALAKQHSFFRTVAEHHRIFRAVAGLASRPALHIKPAPTGEVQQQR